MKYVIECNGILFGPFDTVKEAVDWALDHSRIPWAVRTLHVVP